MKEKLYFLWHSNRNYLLFYFFFRAIIVGLLTMLVIKQYAPHAPWGTDVVLVFSIVAGSIRVVRELKQRLPYAKKMLDLLHDNTWLYIIVANDHDIICPQSNPTAGTYLHTFLRAVDPKGKRLLRIMQQIFGRCETLMKTGSVWLCVNFKTSHLFQHRHKKWTLLAQTLNKTIELYAADGDTCHGLHVYHLDGQYHAHDNQIILPSTDVGKP